MISEPEVKNRYSTPPRPIAATSASLASSACTSVQAPGAIVVAIGRLPSPLVAQSYPLARGVRGRGDAQLGQHLVQRPEVDDVGLWHVARHLELLLLRLDGEAHGALAHRAV